MNDDLRVRSPSTYAVRSSATKRDHVTDNAVNSVPDGNRERHKRARGDSVEFSVDENDDQAGEEHGEQTDRRPRDEAEPRAGHDTDGPPPHGGEDAAPTGEDAAPTGEDAAPTGEDAGPTGEDAAPTGEDAGPGGILDVEA